MKKVSWIVFLALLFGIGWLYTTTWAQQPSFDSKRSDLGSPAPAAEPISQPSPDRTLGPISDGNASKPPGDTFAPSTDDRGFKFYVGSVEQRGIEEKLFNHVQRLKAAKDDGAKAAVMKQMAVLLAQAFDSDMARREHEVSEIEGRVRRLREQIEKRNKAKDDIIGLRLKTIVNEAEGLGFPTPIGDVHPRLRGRRPANSDFTPPAFERPIPHVFPPTPNSSSTPGPVFDDQLAPPKGVPQT